MKNILIFFYFFSCVLFSQSELREKVLLIKESKEKEFNQFLNSHPSFKISKQKDKSLVPCVISDGNIVYLTTYNYSSGLAARANYLHPSGDLGLNLEGDGFFVGVWDGGSVLDEHVEFDLLDSDPLESRVSIEDLDDFSNHATHVCGTIIAGGSDEDALGMAPKARALSFSFANDSFGSSFEDSLLELIDYSEDTRYGPQGLQFSNHSYGLEAFDNRGNLVVPSWILGSYLQESQLLDEFLHDYPYHLYVHACGNSGNYSYSDALSDGYDKLAFRSVAKNVLSVANARGFNVDSFGDLTEFSINTTSSQGPTDDGRVKPDICVDGTNVYSAIADDEVSYTRLSGTSMATPAVTGGCILLQEHYGNLYSNEIMHSATIKGLICHTADDDNLYPGPDPHFGWGALNLKAAAELISAKGSSSAIFDVVSLTQDDSVEYTFVLETEQDLKATISWLDPESPIYFDNDLNNPSSTLVNDLDLRIFKDGDEYEPWKLDLDNLPLAIKGDNTVDNIEQVFIENAEPGTYTIRVTHKDSLDLNEPQVFSLFVSGANIVLSNTKFEFDGLSVWPIPAKDVLNINFTNKYSNLNFDIYDINGRLVKTKSLSSLGSINVSDLNKGFYNLIISDGLKTQTVKFIKE